MRQSSDYGDAYIDFDAARRKQGGSQGLNDNAKGNAKSAGAMLRRYGEQALRDVRIAQSVDDPPS